MNRSATIYKLETLSYREVLQTTKTNIRDSNKPSKVNVTFECQFCTIYDVFLDNFYSPYFLH